MNTDKFEWIFFAGIGGIGMSAMALYFKDKGKIIAGYDRTPSEITQLLEKNQITITFTDDYQSIPDEFTANPEKTLIVFTPAIPPDSNILQYFRNKGFTVVKRAEALGWITEDKYTIAVAGTHGKTTTSWMIAHCLRTAGIDCAALLGGLSVNYGTNYLKAQKPDCQIIIVEADEYDRSFLQLNPDIAVITSTEPDHLDIYGNLDEMVQNFKLFSEKIKKGGCLVKSENIHVDIHQKVQHMISYGQGQDCDVRLLNYKVEHSAFYFDFSFRNQIFKNIRLGVPGLHNIYNFLAALGVVSQITEIEPETILKAAESFSGVKRRFENILKSDKIVYIDDYAHHPTEISATIQTARDLYPDKKITGIFQPHLYSRTRDLAADFARSLAWLDEIILLDIYPARELPIEGVSSFMLLEMIDNVNKKLVSKSYLLDMLADFHEGVLLTMGAGDIDRLVEPIRNILMKNMDHA